VVLTTRLKRCQWPLVPGFSLLSLIFDRCWPPD
jgi:hypothetical protein